MESAPLTPPPSPHAHIITLTTLNQILQLSHYTYRAHLSTLIGLSFPQAIILEAIIPTHNNKGIIILEHVQRPQHYSYPSGLMFPHDYSVYTALKRIVMENTGLEMMRVRKQIAQMVGPNVLIVRISFVVDVKREGNIRYDTGRWKQPYLINRESLERMKVVGRREDPGSTFFKEQEAEEKEEKGGLSEREISTSAKKGFERKRKTQSGQESYRL